MATSFPSSATKLILILLLLAVLDKANSTDYNAQPSSLQWPLPSICPCNCPEQNETSLQMYLHQYPTWPNVPKPNEVGVISSTQPIGFGQMYVDDWFLTMGGPDPNQNVIGRAQGYHIQAGQTVTSWYTSHIFVFEEDWFAGSTLQVLGIINANPSGQWSIIGGTGVFTNAHGTINFSSSSSSTATDVIYALDIHVFYTEET